MPPWQMAVLLLCKQKSRKTTSFPEQLGMHCGSTLARESPQLTSPTTLSCCHPQPWHGRKLGNQSLLPASWASAGFADPKYSLTWIIRVCNRSTDSKAIGGCSVPHTTLTSWSEGFLQQLLRLGKQNLGGRV